MLKKLLVLSFFALPAFAGEEAPPPEAPYPGAQTEPESAPKPKITKKSKAPEEKPEIVEGNEFRGTRRIKHPDAKRGLYRITNKGEFLYKTETGKTNHAISVKLGSYLPSKLVSPNNGFSYTDVYSSSNGLIALFDYEWRLFNSFGKLGLKAGSGLFVASGNARFQSPPSTDPSGVAEEHLTLFMLPNTLATTLYVQFWDRQPLIPYGEAGIDGYVFNEYRDDGNPPAGRFGGALGAHFSGGALIPLRLFDNIKTIRMSQEYGINDIYLALEYRYVVRVAGKFDFSTSYINGGFMVEF